MEFLAGVLIVALLIAVVRQASRLRKLEERLEFEDTSRRYLEGLTAKLTERVSVLEHPEGVKKPEPTPVPAPHPPPVPAAPPAPVPPPVPAPTQVKVCQFCGRAVSPTAETCYCGAALRPLQSPAPVSEPPHPPPVPAPAAPPALPIAASVPVAPPIPVESLRDRLRKKVGDQEWEAMVGGNWLNKLGVLVLVIGIALFLGYEFTRVGPFGRVAIGLGVSLTMLLLGVFVERNPVYRIFARGLIGGGWASLYFTTYAMHAIPAARIIDNPYLGTSLLLLVAVGMILHSLRYRSQTVSGLAYFIAFATLALGESTPFSVLAILPLAASLLFLAYRFEWYKMAVFGLLATYLTCASRPDTGAPIGTTQALFASYWLLFETFDLLRLRRRADGISVESVILPLNSLGFLGLSIVKWQRSAPDQLYVFLAAAAALYLATVLLRVWLRPPNPDQDTLERMAAGGYEGPLTLSAALAASSIFLKAPGMWINAGLAIEGELLFLAGVRFRQKYPRQLAGAVFVSALGRLFAQDVPAAGTTTIAAHAWARWTPVTIATILAFYLNRALRVAGAILEGCLYSSAAAFLVVLVLGYETPVQYVPVAWLVFAAVLFEGGFRSGQHEFLFQSYAVGVLGNAVGLIRSALPATEVPPRPLVLHAIPAAISAAIDYAVALRIRFGGPGRAAPAATWVTSASAAGFLMAIAWRLAPQDYLGLVWLAIGAILLELGLRKLPEQLRWISYLVCKAGFWHIFYFHVIMVHKGSSISEPISLGAAALICYGLSARFFAAMPEIATEQEWVRDLMAAAGTLFALTLAWLLLPAPLVALAWAVVSLMLLEIGFSFSLVRFRMLGNLTGACVFGRLFLANFTDYGSTAHISHRLLTVVPIAISQYYVWSRYRHSDADASEQRLARLYLYAPALLIVALLRFELGRSLAVVGWAVFGLVLYRFGLVREWADLRWQSYAIALLAFWRSWNTNFYDPQSLAGIRGRILTGAVVIASMYCAQLLTPRGEDRSDHHLEKYARSFYSLLASVLLAVLLFYQVSGGALTTAWGLEAIALLAAGFPLRDRLQRLSGLFMLLVCVLKLFLYDFRQLETINRILSFIALGVILVSVSWIYTRFRERLQKFL